MKKIALLIAAFLGFSGLFADEFTDVIQDIAYYTACVCKYNFAAIGEPRPSYETDFYKFEMIEERMNAESRNKTGSSLMYGVCFDYACVAYLYIEKYERYYRSKGMYENKYWVAGVHENCCLTELQYPGTEYDYDVIQNGVPMKCPVVRWRSVKTHDGATHHAWIWIERADGVQFWVDPTWTDSAGYIVYGYVKNGEEIRCRPDRKYCVNYPSKLESLPLPPAFGNQKTQSNSCNSTDRNEIARDTLSDRIAQYNYSTDYGWKDDWFAVMVTANAPFDEIKAISRENWSFGIQFPFMFNTVAFSLGGEYVQKKDDEDFIRGAIVKIDFTKRLFNNFAWYAGGGAGVRYGDSVLAWKGETGFIINLSAIFTKFEIGYDNTLGLTCGVGLGFGFEQ